MTITKNLNGNALEIALEGRLDTMTSPELEAELNNSLGSAESLTLDFSKLDYISSAGAAVCAQGDALQGRHEGKERE